MVKRFIQFILFLLLLLLISLVYLGVYGISTDKFNNLISEKIADKNKDLDINLNDIKIFLNILIIVFLNSTLLFKKEDLEKVNFIVLK